MSRLAFAIGVCCVSWLSACRLTDWTRQVDAVRSVRIDESDTTTWRMVGEWRVLRGRDPVNDTAIWAAVLFGERDAGNLSVNCEAKKLLFIAGWPEEMPSRDFSVHWNLDSGPFESTGWDNWRTIGATWGVDPHAFAARISLAHRLLIRVTGPRDLTVKLNVDSAAIALAPLLRTCPASADPNGKRVNGPNRSRFER